MTSDCQVLPERGGTGQGGSASPAGSLTDTHARVNSPEEEGCKTSSKGNKRNEKLKTKSSFYSFLSPASLLVTLETMKVIVLLLGRYLDLSSVLRGKEAVLYFHFSKTDVVTENKTKKATVSAHGELVRPRRM